MISTKTRRKPNYCDHLALGWLEYCNGTRDTNYANLRRKNGHEKPYNVPSHPSTCPHTNPLPPSGQILGPRQRSLGPLASPPNRPLSLRPNRPPMGQGPQTPRPHHLLNPLRTRRSLLTLGRASPNLRPPAPLLRLHVFAHSSHRHAFHSSVYPLHGAADDELAGSIEAIDRSAECDGTVGGGTRDRDYGAVD